MTQALTPGLNRREIRWIFGGVLMVVALVALDGSIVVTALPAIARELHGLQHLSWVVAGYLLTTSALTLIYGKLADLYGRARLLLFSIVVFLVASVLCAFAGDILQLALARALQGAGGAGLTVLSQTVISDLVAPRERGKYQAFTTSVYGIAGIAGPPVGGFFVEHLSWRWDFWINVPVCIAALVLCYGTTRMVVPVPEERRMDYTGMALFVTAVTTLLLAGTWGGTTYPWTSPPIVLLAFTGAACAAAFIVCEMRAPNPMLPLRLFRSRIVCIVDAAGFMLSLLQYAGVVLVPVFLQIVLGVGATRSGALLIPFLAGSTVTSFGVGQVMRRTGRYKLLMPMGLTSVALGFALLATMDATTSPWLAMLYSALLGLGIGPCFPVLFGAVTNAVDHADVGVTISTVVFSRSLGATVGASLFWALLLGLLAQSLPLDQFAHARELLLNGIPPAGSSLDLERRGFVAALAGAFRWTFAAAAAAAFAGVVLAAFLPEKPLRSTVSAE